MINGVHRAASGVGLKKTSGAAWAPQQMSRISARLLHSGSVNHSVHRSACVAEGWDGGGTEFGGAPVIATRPASITAVGRLGMGDGPLNPAEHMCPIQYTGHAPVTVLHNRP